MTENRNRRRKKRPAYDQAKDAQRRRSANGVRCQNSSHPITNPNFDPDAPRPSRYTERSVDYGSGYPDNSIQFPTGGRPAQNQNRNQNRDPNRRPQNGRDQNGRAGQRPRSSRITFSRSFFCSCSFLSRSSSSLVRSRLGLLEILSAFSYSSPVSP